MKDIYNAREKAKVQMLKGKSRLNALLDALQNTKDKNGKSK